MRDRSRSLWIVLVCMSAWLTCSAAANPARLLHMQSPDRIPGVYKVIFKQKADLRALSPLVLGAAQVLPNAIPDTELVASQLAAALAQLANGTVTHLFFGDSLNGFAVSGIADDALPEALLLDPRVDYIEPAMWFRPSGSPQAVNQSLWDLDRIDQRNLPGDGLYNYTTTAPDVDVYIFDTGVTLFHQEFLTPANCSIPLNSCFSRANNDPYHSASNVPSILYCGNGNHTCNSYAIQPNSSYPLGAPDSGDPCGHGTAMASIIGGKTYGVAKAARLRPIKIAISNCSPEDGGFNDADIIAALKYTTQQLPRTDSGALAYPTVYNMSLGGPPDAVLDGAVSDALSAGVVVVASAGNKTTDACGYSPARLASSTSLITVGASQSDDQAWFQSTIDGGSNFGKCVSLFAPGGSVMAAWNTSLTATDTGSGTSNSAAIVSGIAALYLETHYGATPANVKAAIVQAATLNKLSGIAFGAGSPNLLAYSLIPAGSQLTPPLGSVPTTRRRGVIGAIVAALNQLL